MNKIKLHELLTVKTMTDEELIKIVELENLAMEAEIAVKKYIETAVKYKRSFTRRESQTLLDAALILEECSHD